MDVGRLGGSSDLATVDLHGDVVGDGTSSIGAAIDTAFYKAVGHIDVDRSALILTSTAKDATSDRSAIRRSTHSAIFAFNVTAKNINIRRISCVSVRAAAIYTAFYIGIVSNNDIGIISKNLSRTTRSTISTAGSENISSDSSIKDLCRTIAIRLCLASNIYIRCTSKSSICALRSICSCCNPPINSSSSEYHCTHTSSICKFSSTIHNAIYLSRSTYAEIKCSCCYRLIIRFVHAAGDTHQTATFNTKVSATCVMGAGHRIVVCIRSASTSISGISGNSYSRSEITALYIGSGI